MKLFGHNSRYHEWRKDDDVFKSKNTVPTRKFGDGSIIAWEYFSAKSSTNISVIDARINTVAYQNILEANVMIWIENLELLPDWIF